MSKLNTTRKERTVDGQPLMVGDRVDSGYNQHDVFYQLRRTNKLWLIYCNTRQQFENDNSHKKWLAACKGTLNHPKGLDNGWVFVEMESSEQDARETLAHIDREWVNKEFQRTCLTAHSRAEELQNEQGGTKGVRTSDEQ